MNDSEKLYTKIRGQNGIKNTLGPLNLTKIHRKIDFISGLDLQMRTVEHVSLELGIEDRYARLLINLVNSDLEQ